MTPRSVRNNNPGNLNAGQPWRGLMPRERMNADQKAEDRFAVFSTPEWGFRALCKVLLTYEFNYGLKTVNGIIHRWAPPSENNTTAYVNRVLNDLRPLGINSADQVIDLRDQKTLAAFAKAISIVEAGSFYYTDQEVNVGAGLALQ